MLSQLFPLIQFLSSWYCEK